ncbi:type I 3-dehydroquinate dehydratase [bacterium]|nr:type I 3-dehydroquinate dehydratase [bacterium]
MICLPVAPESRTLARADLLNASRQADLVELCLDRFVNKPDIAELISGLDKPVIVSCRRKKDGGAFEGSEDDRIALLQEALTAGPAYIELELEIAHRIPRHPHTKRLIAINRPFRAITDLADLQQQAANVGADVVKYLWPGVLIDSLEPVLSGLAKPVGPPIVGLPIGHGARCFGVFARRLNSPWVYAALEQGMEIYEGMPTHRELMEDYGLPTVNPQTRLIGVVGFGVVRDRTVKAFNAAFQEVGLNCRCVPIEVGPVDTLPALLEKLQVTVLVVTPGMGEYLFAMVQHPEPAAALGQHVDLLLLKKDGWHGYNVIWRSVLKVVERTLRRYVAEALSLETSNNLIVGGGRIARTLLYGLRQLKGSGMVTAPASTGEVAFCPHCGETLVAHDSTEELAKSCDARYVPFPELLSTRPDVLFVVDRNVELGFTPQSLNPMFLQHPLVVVDLTTLFEETDLLVEARDRGCRVVRPKYLLGEHLSVQFKAVTGQELPDSAFQKAVQIEA